MSFFAEFSIFPRISQTSSHDSHVEGKLQNGTTKGATFETLARMFTSLFTVSNILRPKNLLSCFKNARREKNSLVFFPPDQGAGSPCLRLNHGWELSKEGIVGRGGEGLEY